MITKEMKEEMLKLIDNLKRLYASYWALSNKETLEAIRTLIESQPEPPEPMAGELEALAIKKTDELMNDIDSGDWQANLSFVKSLLQSRPKVEEPKTDMGKWLYRFYHAWTLSSEGVLEKEAEESYAEICKRLELTIPDRNIEVEEGK
jgi:hypothetical protein